MTADEKLSAILAAVQTDPGNRGLARDPADNLFTATAGDFAAACRSIVTASHCGCLVHTGFFIAGGTPPSFETDGPLGAVFLLRALAGCGISYLMHCEFPILGAIGKGVEIAGIPMSSPPKGDSSFTHIIAVERSGPASDGKYYTMKGRDISRFMSWNLDWPVGDPVRLTSISIGDGGNEIGMGKIPHDTIVKNIPNGDLIHCRVPTDYLIVAGVSNWGAYALAAGVYVLRGATPPADLFDPDREREILEVMVREGPLVDGVTGKQTATVDGLSWDEYIKPLVRIRDILHT